LAFRGHDLVDVHWMANAICEFMQVSRAYIDALTTPSCGIDRELEGEHVVRARVRRRLVIDQRQRVAHTSTSTASRSNVSSPSKSS
jgi:hypothetical protein